MFTSITLQVFWCLKHVLYSWMLSCLPKECLLNVLLHYNTHCSPACDAVGIFITYIIIICPELYTWLFLLARYVRTRTVHSMFINGSDTGEVMHITCVGVGIRIYTYSATCTTSNLIIYSYICMCWHKCCLEATLLLWLHHGNNAGMPSQPADIYMYTLVQTLHEEQLACTPDPIDTSNVSWHGKTVGSRILYQLSPVLFSLYVHQKFGIWVKGERMWGGVWRNYGSWIAVCWWHSAAGWECRRYEEESSMFTKVVWEMVCWDKCKEDLERSNAHEENRGQ